MATAATAAEALVLVEDAPYDVVLLDIWLPDRDGLDVLGDIHSLAAETRPEVVIISGHGTIETAVKATKLGAFDFLEKPLSLDRTLIVLKNAVEARRLRAENQEFKRQFNVGSVLTGESVPVKALRQQIRLMAPSNGRVLIYGESGTGKELIARAIHAESLRRDRVFVELNCAAIPEAHIEAELFGYRHGAQPGGPPEQRGTLERADEGSLFLDEVGDMSLKTQAKVLSALDDQMFTPVGGTQTLARGCAPDRFDEQGSRRRDCQGKFPRRSVLSAQRGAVFCAAVARAQAGYPAAGPGVSRRVWAPIRPPSHGDRRRCAGDVWPRITGRATCAN